MKINVIYDLIVTIAGLVPTIISFVLLIKNIIKNKNWTLVSKMALEAMSAVETYSAEHPNMNSEEKLNMALEAVKKSCEVANIKVDAELVKRIISYISEMCSWAKTVNVEVLIENLTVNQITK